MDSRICMAVFTAFLTCLVPNVFSEQVPDASPDPVTGQIEFSIRLYQAIADLPSNTEVNFAVSTIDVFLGLLRLYDGSLPPTSSNLAASLGVSRTVSPGTAYPTLSRNVQRARWGKSSFGEFMLYQNELQLNTTYKQTMFYIYNETGTILQFSKKDDVRQIINNFYASRSIWVTLMPYDFGKTKSIVLAGGGLWKEDLPLEKECQRRCTYHDDFHLHTMWEPAHVRYTYLLVHVSYGTLGDVDATYIELNWAKKSSRVSTYIILPNNVDDLYLVETYITGDTIRGMIGNEYKELIELSLPAIDMESSLELKNILQNEKMQINNVFGGETNFSGLADPPPKQVDEVLNNVNFKAFWADGTVPQCPEDKEPPVNSTNYVPNFKINHPAIIVLVDKGDPTKKVNPSVLGIARLKYTVY